jgi:hypothetical protein
MCFSASVSYSAAAVLVGTGVYAAQQARRLPPPYLMWALVEPGQTSMIGKIRKRVIGGCAMFGAFAGTLVYSVMVFHPEWMSVAVREHSITYDFSFPFRSSSYLPITPAALYALTILVPLLFSSHRLIRIFGWLAAISSVLASEIYGYAYVSVWCFCAAVLSLYLVYMIRLVAGGQDERTVP